MQKSNTQLLNEETEFQILMEEAFEREIETWTKQ